ncbi:MAG: acyltransferase [Clostridiales bacterium]|nr:acyltransferase [Clostridiales bacterium]
MSQLSQRNCCIDSLRLIASFMVICIHSPNSPIAIWLVPLCAVAVPLFFMISGYYLLQDNTSSPKIIKQIRKTAVICIASNILYFFWGVFLFVYSVKGLSAFFECRFSPLYLARFIFLNESPFGYQLWYLGAMIYTLILSLIFISVQSQKIRKIFYWSIPIFLIADLCIGEYSMFLFHTEINYIWVRNFLFTGFPYFLLGNLVYRYRERLTSLFRNWMFSILIFLFCCTTLLEVWFLKSQNAFTPRNHFLSTTFLAFMIFLLAVKKPNLGSCTVLPKWGIQYSLPIYIFHPIILDVLKVLANKLHIPFIYYVLFPPVVFVISLIASMIYVKTFRYIKDRIETWHRRHKNTEAE